MPQTRHLELRFVDGPFAGNSLTNSTTPERLSNLIVRTCTVAQTLSPLVLTLSQEQMRLISHHFALAPSPNAARFQIRNTVDDVTGMICVLSYRGVAYEDEPSLRPPESTGKSFVSAAHARQRLLIDLGSAALLIGLGSIDMLFEAYNRTNVLLNWHQVGMVVFGGILAAFGVSTYLNSRLSAGALPNTAGDTAELGVAPAEKHRVPPSGKSGSPDVGSGDDHYKSDRNREDMSNAPLTCLGLIGNLFISACGANIIWMCWRQPWGSAEFVFSLVGGTMLLGGIGRLAGKI